MSVKMLQIRNPLFESVEDNFTDSTNMICCNNSINVRKFMKVGTKYIIELPETKTTLNVVCTFIAFRACSMKIISIMQNGKPVLAFTDCTINYEYDHFDSIHFNSFAYREHCIIYVSINDILQRQQPTN